MSRRARQWQAARDAKHAAFFGGPEDDDTDDEGGIDARPDVPCCVCGAWHDQQQATADRGRRPSKDHDADCH